MGYRKFNSTAVAEEMIDKIIEEQLPQTDTAYRLLITIQNEWRDTEIGDRAKRLIDDYYKSFSNNGDIK